MGGFFPRKALDREDLRRLTRQIGAALALFGVSLLVVVAYAGWSANQTAVQRERQLVENAFDQAVSRVLNEEKAIAWWDDAVVNATAKHLDLSWLDENFGAYFYETYGHDEIFIVDASNTPIYGAINGEHVGKPIEAYKNHASIYAGVVAEARTGMNGFARTRDGAFSSSQERYSLLLGAQNAEWSGHVISVDGAPAVVTAMAIVPSVDASLLRGQPPLMVSIVRIDDEFMHVLAQSLLLPDLSISSQSQKGAGLVSEVFRADDGAPVGYLNWTSKRPGQSLLVFILPLVALGVLGVGLLAWDMIERLKRATVDLQDREAQARFESKHDQLSGLPNRHHFVEKLQEQLDQLVQARRGQKVVVAYLDVDRFKDVNDTMGHQAGDSLIMAVAGRLREHLDSEDFLSRFGGDEFAILRVCGNENDALALARRLRDAFELGFDVGSQRMRMTVSIGIAIGPGHGVSPDELMRCADIALYQAKNNGRDRAMIFSAEMAAEVEQRHQIEHALRDALRRDELTLHYQPLVSSVDGRVRGLEALLRWRSAERGDIPPSTFVPIAEEAGIMPELGAWVLERAFKDSLNWPDLYVSVNLSPVQFRHMDLVAHMRHLLGKYPVDPSRILLEVTEGVLLESTDRNRSILDSFRALGFKIALDDFGTGYSSLRYLSDFRFDKIKIDRAFVTNINERKRAMTIIQSVVTLGRGLGMEVVAEGVETEVETSVMRLVGVNELQGFYFSKPVAVEDVPAMLARLTPANDAAETQAQRPAASI